MGDAFLPGDFLDPLLHNLHQLYDPAALQRSPLLAWFGLSAGTDPALALRRTLTDAIERLRPEPDVPSHANAWRYYHILRQRFVEQYSQQEVADDLGLSVRQLRRQEKTAVEVLAESLWRRYGPAPVATPAAPPRLDHELAWSQQAFAHETVNAVDLMETVLRVGAPLLLNHAVSAQLDTPAHAPILAVARVPAEQALLALLTAVVQVAGGGRVVLQLAPVQAGLAIRYRVEDAAPAATVALQASAAFRMGLQLVEMLGGTVSALAKPDGPLCEVILPIAPVVQVLAIDDNPDTLALWARYVEGTRYQLTGMQDATQAVRTALELSPQVILLDVMLPEIDGWEVLGQLRAHPHLKHLSVVVCTILPQSELAQALGAAAFLRKPAGRREFLAVLEAQMERL